MSSGRRKLGERTEPLPGGKLSKNIAAPTPFFSTANSSAKRVIETVVFFLFSGSDIDMEFLDAPSTITKCSLRICTMQGKLFRWTIFPTLHHCACARAPRPENAPMRSSIDAPFALFFTRYSASVREMACP